MCDADSEKRRFWRKNHIYAIFTIDVDIDYCY